VILYSVIPLDVVLNENKNENKSNNKSDNINDYNFVEVDYLGQKVIASQISGNRYVINRLISTQLKAYLDPRLQPGTIINIDLP